MLVGAFCAPNAAVCAPEAPSTPEQTPNERTAIRRATTLIPNRATDCSSQLTARCLLTARRGRAPVDYARARSNDPQRARWRRRILIPSLSSWKKFGCLGDRPEIGTNSAAYRLACRRACAGSQRKINGSDFLLHGGNASGSASMGFSNMFIVTAHVKGEIYNLSIVLHDQGCSLWNPDDPQVGSSSQLGPGFNAGTISGSRQEEQQGAHEQQNTVRKCGGPSTAFCCSACVFIPLQTTQLERWGNSRKRGMGRVTLSRTPREEAMQRFKTSMLSTAFLVLPVMAMAESPMDTKADIQKAADQYMAAYNNRDAAALGKMHSDDASVSLSQWTVQGRPAIEAAFTKEFGAGVQFTNITVEQSQRTGDINVSRGTWAAEMKGPDGKTMPISGHWLIVGTCQGQGGSSCLISQHVGNTNMPPPQQTSTK